MGDIALIIGQQGTGKTTLAKLIQDEYNGKIYDDLHYRVYNENILTIKAQIERKAKRSNIIITSYFSAEILRVFNYLIDHRISLVFTGIDGESRNMLEKLFFVPSAALSMFSKEFYDWIDKEDSKLARPFLVVKVNDRKHIIDYKIGYYTKKGFKI